MAQRSDAPLIKHLAQSYGPEVAREWQRPPLVVLPGEDFMAYLGSNAERLIGDMGEFPQRPWADCVFDFRGGIGMDDPENGYYSASWWTRVRSLDALLCSDDPLLTPVARTEIAALAARPQEWLAIDTWEFARRADGALGYPRHAYRVYSETRIGGVYAKGMCGDPDCGTCSPVDEAYSEVCAFAFSLCIGTLAYLTQCNEHLVEVAPKPAKPLPPNQQKIQEQKPWLKESLPHYILLDPQKVGEYGHPSGRGAPTGMQHAPPRPHTRRGHWAVLRHERFARDDEGNPRRVWVKQAWVGATEWDYLDQRYRVVLPKKAEVH